MLTSAYLYRLQNCQFYSNFDACSFVPERHRGFPSSPLLLCSKILPKKREVIDEMSQIENTLSSDRRPAVSSIL